MREADLSKFRPAAHIDRKLLQKLHNMEAGYTRDNLLSTPLRREHLELSAEIFALYAGEQKPQEGLVRAVHYLSASEYAQLSASPNSAAVTDETTGEIYVNRQSRLLSNSVTNTFRRAAWTHWSALTTARAIIYQHEWFHRAGVIHRTDFDPPVDVAKYYQGPFELTHSYGFSYRLRNRDTGEPTTDNTLEEAFAYLMNSGLEKDLTGFDITLDRVDHVVGPAAQATNRGRQRLKQLLQRKPEWAQELKRFHREEDPLSFGRFLVRGTNYLFVGDQAEQYSRDLLFSLTLTASDSAFQDYLAHLR